MCPKKVDISTFFVTWTNIQYFMYMEGLTLSLALLVHEWLVAVAVA